RLPHSFCSFLFSLWYCYLCDLLSFPTRRSSDLVPATTRRTSAAPRPCEGGNLCRGARSTRVPGVVQGVDDDALVGGEDRVAARENRKSTRLNSSHVKISYAVFCLKKKKHVY